MLSLKDCINFLNTRPEFTGLQESQVRYENLACSRNTLGVFNPDWIMFTNLSAINKVSDGLPRYVFYGALSVQNDGAILNFFYRNFQQYLGNGTIENYLTQESFIFDRASVTTAVQLLMWQFTGYIIDRGA